MYNFIKFGPPFDADDLEKVYAAIGQDGIEKFEATHDGYSFWLKGISTEIKIVISINGLYGGFNFHLSHAIHTPKQVGPYFTSRPWGDDAAYALKQAINAIVQYYNEAVKAGFMPNASWLVSNE